jgi:hypothetical protein
MHNFFKQITVFVAALSMIGTISASEAVITKRDRDPDNSHIILSHALIQDEFSGLEVKPIVKAFMSWMEETKGDILIIPPDEADVAFYELAMKDDNGEIDVFEADLQRDGAVKEPWGDKCRHSFYILRAKSKSAVVKAIDGAIDGEVRQVMAFTFVGCNYKFIVVVADRMKDENVMYTTLLHELGHIYPFHGLRADLFALVYVF